MYPFLKRHRSLIGSLVYLAIGMLAAWYLAYRYGNYVDAGQMRCTGGYCVELWRHMTGADRLTTFLVGVGAALVSLAIYHAVKWLGSWWFHRSAEYLKMQADLDRARAAVKNYAVSE